MLCMWWVGYRSKAKRRVTTNYKTIRNRITRAPIQVKHQFSIYSWHAHKWQDNTHLTYRRVQLAQHLLEAKSENRKQKQTSAMHWLSEFTIKHNFLGDVGCLSKTLAQTFRVCRALRASRTSVGVGTFSPIGISWRVLRCVKMFQRP